jgi:hypothetical protein
MAIANKHLQSSEKSKFMQSNKFVNTNKSSTHTIYGKSVIKDLLDANTIVLPFAINTHGQWGPITQSFLSTPTTPSNALHFPTI